MVANCVVFVPKGAVTPVVAEIPVHKAPPNPSPLLISNCPDVVLKMVNPMAGLTKSVCCKVVILGNNNPLVVDVKSNIEDASGVLVPMPICALAVTTAN